MLDQNTFILIAVGAAFSVVGLLAWLVDAGLSDKSKVFVKYGLFSLFACVIGLFFMIDDDSEFQYGGWTNSEAPQKSSSVGGGMGGSGGAGGQAAKKGGAGGGGLVLGDEEPMDHTESATEADVSEEGEEGDGVKQDCPTCPEIVPIKKGKALIGSANGGSDNGGQSAPASEVAITRNFGIGKYEVTFEQYNAFATETGYKPAKTCQAGKTSVNFEKPGFKQAPANPAVCVSFKDALAYVEWLTLKTSIPYRLPTEIEWEYAARAGLTGAYFMPGPVTGDLANFAAKEGRRVNGTAPVGTYPANGNDMHDVHGNAWEMTADCWSKGYLNGSGQSPAGDVDCTRRVAKGGAWYSGPAHLDFATRVGVSEEFANNGLGFRVVRENAAPMGRKKSRLSNGFADGLPENSTKESGPQKISYDPVAKRLTK
ncbi:MAG: formylglycine-generating enzyme family protein [Alphaproteobacteria bacterium]|nr:formylglycine-generating enzyme family protein [Alphaproteobacteria bacterium]